MAPNLHKLFSTLIFLITVPEYPLQTTSQTQECPYPCYPPPIGPSNNPIPNPAPPVSTTPPVNTAPPEGFLPFTPPYFSGGAPPPPEPMVTWFPYFYRKPTHQDQSSSPPRGGPGKKCCFVLAVFPVLFSLF